MPANGQGPSMEGARMRTSSDYSNWEDDHRGDHRESLRDTTPLSSRKRHESHSNVNAGARKRSACTRYERRNSTGQKWRRRYRARRRAYLSNDPWIQRHAHWRPINTCSSTRYGFSPVLCRVVSKLLTLWLDHGSISNQNGCCCKTESLHERYVQYISDTLITTRAAPFAYNFMFRILTAPMIRNTSNALLEQVCF